MQYTVVIYGGTDYEPGEVLILRVEADSPGDACRVAEEDQEAAACDYMIVQAAFAGWHDDLRPPDYRWPMGFRGRQ